MLDQVLLLDATDTIWTRLGGCAIAVVVGVILIVTGRQNILTQVAEESGRRRLVNRALGRSNTYTGSKAVMLGWTRLIGGICIIVFGIVFSLVGPFLANDADGSPRMHSLTRSPASRWPSRPHWKPTLPVPRQELIRGLNDNTPSDPFAKTPQDQIASVVTADLTSHAYEEVLRRLLKFPGVTTASANSKDGSATYRLAPITDVRALAAAIDFGVVTSIDEVNHTVYVKVDASRFPPPSSRSRFDVEELIRRQRQSAGVSQ
jgi:hypothetical protein